MEVQTIFKHKTLSVGDLFYSIWGYDQTNYDYFIVVEISPSGKTAKIQRAKYETIESTSQCNIQRPLKKGYGKMFRVRVENDNDEIRLRGSVPFCENNEETHLETLWSAENKELFWETDSQAGH